jgi:hypothetical protein
VPVDAFAVLEVPPAGAGQRMAVYLHNESVY